MARWSSAASVLRGQAAKRNRKRRKTDPKEAVSSFYIVDLDRMRVCDVEVETRGAFSTYRVGDMARQVNGAVIHR